ncbi:MAG: hypothetical protein HY660_00040 [Armatimonadetes bacterium]|nr:hypothetical protein [Armatimonadota bacterium]
MERLRTPLMVDAIYLFLLGLCTLSPSLVQGVFGYEVKDPGILLVLSGLFFGFGVVVWATSKDPNKYGGLAQALVIALIIGAVFLLWGWLRGLYTPRNVIAPLIINIALAVWIWMSKGES